MTASPFHPHRVEFVLKQIHGFLMLKLEKLQPDDMLVIQVPYDLMAKPYKQGELVMAGLIVGHSKVENVLKALRQQGESQTKTIESIQSALTLKYIPCMFVIPVGQGHYTLVVPYGPDPSIHQNALKFLSPGGQA